MPQYSINVTVRQGRAINASVSGLTTVSTQIVQGGQLAATVVGGGKGEPGSPGTPGVDGADGQGVPVGGTTGQVLQKATGDDYDTEWVSLSADDFDKSFVYNFTNQSTIVVAHNLNKYPAVLVIDSSGDEVDCDIEYDSLNQLSLTSSGSFTGTVYCN